MILFLLSNAGCRKACRYAKLPRLQGGDGFAELTSTVVYEKGYIMGGQISDYIITNPTTYDSIFNNQRPCGEVDFNNRFIIASCRNLNPNDGLKMNSNIYLSTSSPILKFRVDYSLHNQCNGSGIYRYNVTFLATVPNSFLGYQIIYDIRDVNPF